ncbi:hypothetical protein QE152_g1103 [Popillia japonica]|uniref:Uncharacterized protein n=1 Tax=Popillia japonica TaxID=7064 RepID=A0AAW1N7U6_POPJA
MEFININYGAGGDDSGDYSSDGVAWNDADCPPRLNIRRQDDDDPQPSTSGYGHHEFVEDDDDDEKRRRGRGQPPTSNYTDDDDEHDRGRRRRRSLRNVDGQEGNNNGNNNNRQTTPKKTRTSSGRNYFITITFLMDAVRLRHARQDFLQLFDRDDIISYCVSIERNYGTTETDDRDDIISYCVSIERNYGTTETDDNNIRGRGRPIRIGLDGNVAVDDDDDANKIYHLYVLD